MEGAALSTLADGCAGMSCGWSRSFAQALWQKVSNRPQFGWGWEARLRRDDEDVR